MDMSQLRSFIAVAEAGSYIKAADVLGIPQPTLSRQVRTLEIELRACLFHRHGRGVRLTDKGSNFLEYARSVIHMVEAAILSVRDNDSVFTGQLAIGLTPSIGRILIPRLVPLLKAQFPLASIRLIEGLSGALYEKVLLGQIDFALLLSPASSPHLSIEPLATEQLYLIGPATSEPEEDIALKSIVDLPLILPHSNQWTRPAVETAAAKLGLRLRIDLEVDSTASTIEMVTSGGGYSIMPGSLQQLADNPPLSWRKINQPYLEATISLITSTRQPCSKLVQAAAQLVKQTWSEVTPTT